MWAALIKEVLKDVLTQIGIWSILILVICDEPSIKNIKNNFTFSDLYPFTRGWFSACEVGLYEVILNPCEVRSS